MTSDACSAATYAKQVFVGKYVSFLSIIFEEHVRTSSDNIQQLFSVDPSDERKDLIHISLSVDHFAFPSFH